MSQELEPSRMSARDFQSLYLDQNMHHSSGWFLRPEESLSLGQARKSRRLSAILGIQPGMRVLDVGCSWGGLARYMARRGAHVTGLTLGPEHASWAPKIPGLEIVVQRWQDYAGTVDRVSCINALENFDERPAFFHGIRNWLKPGGRAVIWSVTADSPLYRAPSLSDILQWAGEANLEVAWLLPGLARHYAMTLRHFILNLQSARIPPELRAAHALKNRQVQFYDTSRILLETGRNDMIEIGLRRVT